MKPLVVLIVVFVISVAGVKLYTGDSDYSMAGRIGLSAMLFLTASGHFMFKKGMVMMIPPPVPFKPLMVYVTGIIEIIAAVTLHVPELRTITGWLLILFFIVLLPANSYAASKQINMEKATYDGPGLKYLWFRVPLQLFFIAWTYLCSIG
ncbi:hypothetical protein GS399_14870 [Pedobacter sp. HMF7647]|uniref:DoxX family membrane protein n=1 Tax=Hufsiella arboris TaxID=2695275 RepID=A0A7K1YDZ9_9SPHI|nr:hypothetical protein [Hufsiella arboris]MXV52258.1 hypothetical protein [Hufsiella arboris]